MILEDWKRQKQEEQAKRLREEEVKKSALATLKETLSNHYDIEREMIPAAKLQTKSLLDYAKLKSVCFRCLLVNKSNLCACR
jgi:hypothetical protein